MFKLKIPRAELEDLVKKMSLPTGRDKFVFETIAPEIRPDGYLEWIGKSKDITVWVQARKLDVSGITKPIRIPLVSLDVLKTLSRFNKKNIVTLTHYKNRGEDVFTTNDEKRKKTTRLPSIDISGAKEMKETFPAQLADDGVILYRGGRRPDLHATCDVNFFKELVASTNLVMGSKKKDEMSNIYHIVFDEDNSLLRTIAGDDTDSTHIIVSDEIYTDSVSGNGTVHYSMGFYDVINVLTGEIDVYALAGGPLWIVQKGEKQRIRYIVLPAKLTCEPLLPKILNKSIIRGHKTGNPITSV